MIRTQSDGQSVPGDNFILRVDHWFFYNRADRQNDRLRRIDDGEEIINAVAAKIGNGERAALIFFGLEFFGAGARGEVFDRFADLAQRFGLRGTDDRRDQTVFHRHGDG